MADQDPRTRRPKASYRDSNGFLDSTRLRAQASVPTPNMHVVAKASVPPRDTYATDSPDPALAPERQALRDAVERRQFAEDVLQLKGTYFPGLTAAKEMEERPETAASIKEHISDLQRQHYVDLRTLYAWQADDYLDDALDRYHANDDAAPELDEHYQAVRGQNSALMSAFDEAFSAHCYAHLGTIIPLFEQHAQLAVQEEDERRRRDAQFPMSIAEYRAIRNKDIQMRVARFLMADIITRERMTTQYGWVWRQTKPLSDDYQINRVFKLEIDSSVNDIEARDPRRKPSLNSVA
ncbi:hypothetical protein B0H21DRAFT_50111 [Amylocystis lapponica]|nr:hypothetical protein B0H21DRAFT_50111 [Amylocystis lapponica]